MRGWLFFILVLAGPAHGFSIQLINGKVVRTGFEEVVLLSIGSFLCTGTIVGPRVVLTAAHCVENGDTVEFDFKGKHYKAIATQSERYHEHDLDLAVAVTARPIAGAEPFSIGGEASTGLSLLLMGYGCTTDEETDEKSILRKGKSVVTGFDAYDIVSSTPGGAAICFGDSGGPAFVRSRGGYLLTGVNSKGDISNVNYNTRMDHGDSSLFLQKMIADQKITICGVNRTCPPRS